LGLLLVTPAYSGHNKTPWDHTESNSSKRFKVLDDYDNAAVLDKETGLVWEQSPDTNTRTWFNALSHCYTRLVGGRKGWRLPTIEELASLVDPTQVSPALPAGHPFTNVVEVSFWSATTLADNPSRAWLQILVFGFLTDDFKTISDSYRVWCVRGGQGIDGVQ